MQDNQIKNNNISIKICGYFIIFFILFMAFLSVLILSLEFLGLTRSYNFMVFPQYSKIMKIHETDYYKKTTKWDPYAKFYTKAIHPYYYFSLPWRQNEIASYNNSIISLGVDGFRSNPNSSYSYNYNVLFLGGSSAFSQYATSDNNSIAALISKKLKANVVNRNAPSWNSYQELLASVKYLNFFDLSMSFTGSNDLKNCERQESEIPFDAPDIFLKLMNNYTQKDNLSFVKKIKKFLAESLPDTAVFYTNIKRHYLKTEKVKYNTLNNSNLYKNLDTKLSLEKKIIDKCMKKFTDNQKTIRLIAKARGARHLIIFQPQYSLHDTANHDFSNRSLKKIILRKYAIRNILKSSLCKKDCINLSSVFDGDNYGGASHFREIKNSKYIKKYFVDEVHLTDTGNEVVSSIIADSLRFIKSDLSKETRN